MRRWLLLLRRRLRRLLVWRLLRRLLHAPCARAHSRRVDVLLMRKKKHSPRNRHKLAVARAVVQLHLCHRSCSLQCQHDIKVRVVRITQRQELSDPDSQPISDRFPREHDRV